MALQGVAGEVRQLVQHQIVARNKTPAMLPDPTSEDSLESRPHGSKVTWIYAGTTWALRLGGLLPWSVRFFWLSLAYQIAVLLLHVAILLFSLARFPMCQVTRFVVKRRCFGCPAI